MSSAVAFRVVAAIGGIAGCVLAAVGHPSWAAGAIAIGVGIGAIAVDLSERRIPTPLVVIGAIAGIVAALTTAVVDESWSPVLELVAGAALIGGAFLLVHLAQPSGLGFGDVRLAALVGGLVAYGTDSIPTAVATAVLAAVVAAVTTIVTRGRSAPFAPYLLGAALILLIPSAIG